MKYIDLRSDTVTLPTETMKKAMLNAELGDDVYRDDPTVIELETLASEMTGKEAGLFVPSGTFGNQLALLTHTNRGDEVILQADCHIKKYEVGASSVIAGVQLSGIEGIMSVEKINQAIRGEDIHFPRTSLICLENATGFGRVLSIDYMKAVYQLAKKQNINVHLDGARIFNAALALNVDVKEISKYADSVMFCLSKGLCAPIGSMLVGSKAFIERARKNRKLMGGGLRQVGIIAACGVVALKEMTKRLHVDHENAQYLAKGLSELPGINVLDNQRDINMVFITISDEINFPDNFSELLREKGIKVNGYRGEEIRFVTHNDIDKKDIDYVIEVIKGLIK
jgi:threonine aldolase